MKRVNVAVVISGIQCGMSNVAIADMAECSERTVSRIRSSYIKDHSENKPKNINAKDVKRDRARGILIKDLAEKYKCSTRTIHRKLTE